MTLVKTEEVRISATRRAALGLALGGAFAAGSAAAAAAPGPQAAGLAGGRAAGRGAFAEVAALAQEIVANHASPGLSISVMRRGRLVWSRGFGFANLETRTATTPRSVFRVGSVTKQFTGAAICALAEDGKLSVDDPLARHLPDFPRARDITLRQMLNHTSGLGNFTATRPPEAYQRMARVDYDAKALFAAMAATDPLFVFEPGADWAYSNTAYVLLGLVIEKVTGRPFGETFRRRLFTPAGMDDTAVDSASDVVEGRANGYAPRQGAGPAFDNVGFTTMTLPAAAGAIRSTSIDLCLWHDALFGGRILKPQSLTAMTTPGLLKNGSLPMTPPPLDPRAPKQPMRYGYGLFVEDFEGRRRVGHAGGINGFVSQLQTFPEQGVTFSALLNVDGSEKLLDYANRLVAALSRASLAIA